MSVFIPVVEQPRHARPKPDLRLAESYIPALVLYLKCIGYTCIAPIILLMQWRITVLCIAAFALLLYVDHLYLSNGIIPFIDTTALCLDVFGSTLLMLAISILRPCSQQCQGVLGIWTFLGSAYVIASVLVPRPIAHACAFILALLFIYADTSNGNGGGGGGSMMITSQQQQGVSFTTVSFNQTLLLTNTILVVPPLSFFFRTTLYVILGLVDIYLFRPLFQQENERLLFCKYAPVLLGSWPWYIIFGLFLGTAQLVKHLRLIKLPHYSQISYNSSSSGSNHSQQSSGAVIGGTNGSSQNCYQTTSNNNMGSSSSAQHYHHNDGASTLVQHNNNNNNNSFTIPILSSSSSTSNIMMTGAHHHHHVPSSSAATSSSFGIHKNVQELDIMEAFRLAKEQRMGAKGAN